MTTPSPFSHWQAAIDADAATSKPAAETKSLATLRSNFQFSQGSLQDYMDCARRFQLRYVQGQRWPAVQAEPIEEHERLMEKGSEFHLLVQRHLLGIPVEQVTPADPEIAAWWDAYLKSPPPGLPEKRLPEVQLSAGVAGGRLLARYDMLAIDPGERVVIVDWKTTRAHPPRETLARRMQTLVYPYVLVEAGRALFGGPIRPEQVSFVYWFSNRPANVEVFSYSTDQHEANRARFEETIREINERDPDEVWPLTADVTRCGYCVYRSLCERGVQAAPLSEAADIDEFNFTFDFDLDTVEELAF